MTVLVDNLKKLVQLTAFVLFVIQIIGALQKYVNPPVASSPSLQALESLNRPVLVSVCRNSQFNYTHAEALSYNTSTNFFKGIAGNANGYLSWSGPTGNQSFQDLLDTLYNSKTDDVMFRQNDNAPVTKFLLPTGVCKVLKVYPTSSLDVYVDIADGSYIITVSDPAFSSSFMLSDHLMTGERILSKPKSAVETKVYSNYRIQLTETRTQTNDGSCTHYPNNEHESFFNCVEGEMEGNVLPVLGCMIPWMSSKDQCTGLISRLPAHQDLYKWLSPFIRSSWKSQGYFSDRCLPPCSVLSAHSTFLRAYARTTLTYDRFSIYFDNQVKVNTRLLMYDVENLLVDFGSSLGLWLGISVVGIFDVFVLLASRCERLRVLVK